MQEHCARAIIEGVLCVLDAAVLLGCVWTCQVKKNTM
jgi:hypothetical protein